MNRHRRGRPTDNASSSSDDDDVFTALSRKPSNNKSSKKVQEVVPSTSISSQSNILTQQQKLFTKVQQIIPSDSIILPTPKCSVQQILDDHVENSTNVFATETTKATNHPVSKVTLSSAKRHHGAISDTRKAKMDALLLELQSEKSISDNPNQRRCSRNIRNDSQRKSSTMMDGDSLSHNGSVLVPDKKGSFVEPGEELETTNIFVGNLAPSITEEEMTDLFRQFGDLYSVKIMWPRTAEERIRNRHTGFVCFMNRRDAEDAMEACSEADPFNVGRRLLLRWGKNVKKIVKRGTGGIPVAPILQRREQQRPGTQSRANPQTSTTNSALTTNDIEKHVPEIAEKMDGKDKNIINSVANSRIPKQPILVVDPEKNLHKVIHVQVPSDPRRANFISTVASYVAKDGYQLERAIMQKEFKVRDSSESSPNQFDFLIFPNVQTSTVDTEQKTRLINDHQYYKWRVYSFCHGDGFFKWKTEPFLMFQPYGCIWIPPSITDEVAARREELEIQQKEENIIIQRKQRMYQHAQRHYVTGRQLEHQKQQQRRSSDHKLSRNNPKDGSTSSNKQQLNSHDIKIFEQLFVRDLCASRLSICHAMAFCFEKSFATHHVSSLLQDLLSETNVNMCSIDTMIARIFLLSDILYNSQQPGVRNAFHYRDAIQKMAPTVFASIGNVYKNSLPGRLSQERITNAFHAVLAAWTNWGVFDPAFLDELDARFQGKEISRNDTISHQDSDVLTKEKRLDEQEQEEQLEIVTYDQPTSSWVEVRPVEEEDEDSVDSHSSKRRKTSTNRVTTLEHDSRAGDGTRNDAVSSNVSSRDGWANVDLKMSPDEESGNAMSHHPSRDPSKVASHEQDPDGEALECDPDGEPMDDDSNDEDLDGEPIKEDLNGKPINDDLDGKTTNDDLDGEDMDGEDLDGEDIDGEDMDGEDLDGEDLDGEELDVNP